MFCPVKSPDRPGAKFQQLLLRGWPCHKRLVHFSKELLFLSPQPLDQPWEGSCSASHSSSPQAAPASSPSLQSNSKPTDSWAGVTRQPWGPCRPEPPKFSACRLAYGSFLSGFFFSS